ncbi:RNA exonuclease 1 homolog isoform X2 [Sceloporus undulatus]|uniref:RNA exonuclease 1 homolog isoform X2 n=1 Tax=Sceloporus undulatus TaxID=8520 RepID=UPI001C4C6834|nr:RNA exonuclease 1 homolog isoform X2 [Sceloporus undulatus]
MFRSAGYFKDFLCPFFHAGGCGRPHCQYRHSGAGLWEAPPTAQRPLRAPSERGLDKNIEELERINKEIQSVKTEFEEQKKLLYYSFGKDNIKNSLTPAGNYMQGNKSFSDEDDICNAHIKAKDCDISVSNNPSKSSKYTLDRSFPATDLEYDPLLNYCAGLRSSLKAEYKNDTHRYKRVKMFPCGNLEGTTKNPPCENRCRSSKKRSRNPSPIKLEIKMQESEDDTIIIDAPPMNIARKPRIHMTCKKQNRKESKEGSRTSAETVQNSKTPGTLSSMVEKTPKDTTVGLGNINSANGNKIEMKSTNGSCSSSGLKVNLLNLGNADEHCYFATEESNVSSQTNKEISSREDIFLENSHKDSGIKNVHGDIEGTETNVLDCPEEKKSQDDTELFESDDTMEECRRIFNEFVECEMRKEKRTKKAFATAKDPGLKTSMLSRQKRRIAHTAKFGIKASKEIIVPLKTPLPQQICPSKPLQAQQEAIQITTSVKSGQAFVAATCGSKKSTPVMPATPIQSMGPMVCLNVLEVQPIATNSGQVNILLPGNAITAVPCSLSSHGVKKSACMPVKMSSQRRSVVPELGSKVPNDIRQRYVNLFVEEFLKTCDTENEAFDKALTEEKAIYGRCGSKNMYLNIAVNRLKKLRDHGSVSSDGQCSTNKGTISASFKKQDGKHDFSGIALYRVLKDYVLTEEELKENGFPEPNPEKPGSALLKSGTVKLAISDTSRRLCCRCGKIYTVTLSGKHVRKEECNYHSGKVLRHKVPGGLETRYSCCEGVVGSPGCQVAKLHVHDGRNENTDGFVKTFIKPPPLDGNHGVFALDCEMCYTTHGLELSRVTVVDPTLYVVYDAFVKPDHEIIDFNNRLYGAKAEKMKTAVTSIRDVQAVLLNLFSTDTILIGHNLQSDLFALKLFHSKIVDTSVVFPHRLGLPHKRALRNLMADYLQRIIQDDVGGRDCSEDATACMELMLWKVRDGAKGRR